ncbi:hypothetical protein WGT02_14200 [Rhizobium sp. T1470]|uniref:hypothetical protein n=1 Tax=unclassified Rhizobium TaxID=2613769 RepID=UPI001CD5DDC3|nr:hypothetical protein [Rhizobium sp. T1473]MCA0802366.1 hypothetical protein [Rhizobium sp. T1473]
MTNDPASNLYLAKFTRRLNTPEAGLLRTVILSLMAGHACKGSATDEGAGIAFLKQNGYFDLRGKAWDDANFLAQTEFKQFDYRELAHLCAGIDYLFGNDGIIARNVVSKGLGEPSFPYDPNNPYIRVPGLPKRGK